MVGAPDTISSCLFRFSRPVPDRPAEPNPVVAFLAREGRADRLLAEHVDDGNGHCCVCTAAPQSGRVTWPCSLANYAAWARELVAGRRGVSGS